MADETKRDKEFIPCVDYCYVRFGREYRAEDCDNTCAYAKVVKENSRLHAENNILAYRVEQLEDELDELRKSSSGNTITIKT